MKLTKKEEKLHDKLLLKWCVDESTLTDKEKQQLQKLKKKKDKPTKEQAAALAVATRASYLHRESFNYWVACMNAVNRAFNS